VILFSLTLLTCRHEDGRDELFGAKGVLGSLEAISKKMVAAHVVRPRTLEEQRNLQKYSFA